MVRLIEVAALSSVAGILTGALAEPNQSEEMT
jgi:hypothetical protein